MGHFINDGAKSDSTESNLFGRRSRACRGRDAGAVRQLDNESRSARRIVLDPDVPAMVGDHLVHDGQAQPGSPFLGREIGHEHLVSICAGNPGAIVEHLDPQLPVGGPAR